MIFGLKIYRIFSLLATLSWYNLYMLKVFAYLSPRKVLNLKFSHNTLLCFILILTFIIIVFERKSTECQWLKRSLYIFKLLMCYQSFRTNSCFVNDPKYLGLIASLLVVLYNRLIGPWTTVSSPNFPDS